MTLKKDNKKSSKKNSKKNSKNVKRIEKIDNDNISISSGGSVDSNSITLTKYLPITINIPTNTDNIFDTEVNINFSTSLDYPKFSYGFHHYIHAEKNNMKILKDFENKKKVYLVMNNFERYIDNYDKSIGEISKSYFDIKDKPDILSRGFYKLWELMFMFDIVDTTKDNFVSAHLAEGPGSFIQAVVFFRDKFTKKGLSKNDKFYAVTLHSEENDKYVPDLEKKFVEYYEEEKPKRFFLHKTYTKQVAGGIKNKDNGDITDPKTIKLFGGDMKEKADLITGDGGFDWANENVQEQEALRLILAEIVAAFKLQKKGGSFVLKVFETFAQTSVKFICLLASLYNKVFITKPLMSRPSNSEKYIVCVDFKYSDSDKEYKNISKQLDLLLSEAHTSKNSLKIVDIYPEYKIPKKILDHVMQINIKIANEQFKSLNEILKFINSNNYYGDTYQDHREMQIEASKYWIDLFFPDPAKYKEYKTKIVDISFISNKMNVDKSIELGKLLIE